MKNSVKNQLAKTFGGNMELNKKALQMKNSWDEVSGLLGKGLKKKGNSK
ncbi:MAG: hypothetical protein K0R05_2412 [Anaerocolumna sp.]|jgi:hypothetical protein|nr:hypothetical protein [Anaerocolumna sp.]